MSQTQIANLSKGHAVTWEKLPPDFVLPIEFYRRVAERYEPQEADANGRHWIAEMGLFLGVWQGTKAERTGYWLRWWNEEGEMLLWGIELVEQERRRVERLAERLRDLGVDDV